MNCFIVEHLCIHIDEWDVYEVVVVQMSPIEFFECALRFISRLIVSPKVSMIIGCIIKFKGANCECLSAP